MLKLFIPILTLTSLCLLVIVLSLTTPSSAGPFGILVVFFLIYISSFGLMTIFLFGLNKFLKYLVSIFCNLIQIRKMTLKQSSYFASIIATAPVMIFALRSVGVVSWYGYLLVLVFISIGCLYVSRKIM
jgi:hypothetical protein